MAKRQKKKVNKQATKTAAPQGKKYDMGGKQYAGGKSTPASTPKVVTKPSGAKPQASASPQGKVSRAGAPQRIMTSAPARAQTHNLPAVMEQPKVTTAPPRPSVGPQGALPQAPAQKLLPAPKVTPKMTMPAGAPRAMPTGGALPALGGAMGVTAGVEMAHALTPEGVGSKGGGWSPVDASGNQEFRGERITPEDYNTYQGPLKAFGKFGEGVDALASGAGRAAGEISTYLPPALGGIRNADGSVPKVADGGMPQDEEFYQSRYGVGSEGYGALQGSEQLPQGRTPLGLLPSHTGTTDEDMYEMQKAPASPIEIDKGGKVRANPRYGMPDAPDTQRRSLAERFGDVTGGGVPDTMEGFMVANFLQNQLRMDDSRRVGDSKDIYKADLTGLNQWNKTDLEAQGLDSLIAGREAQAVASTALASKAPSEIKKNEALTKKYTKETDAVLDKDEAVNQKVKTNLMDNARAMVVQKMKLQFPDMDEGELNMSIEAGELNKTYAELLKGYMAQEAIYSTPQPSALGALAPSH